MEPDPTIDEIREVRKKISAEIGHDPQRLLAHYVEYEKKLEREGRFRFANATNAQTTALELNDKPPKKEE